MTHVTNCMKIIALMFFFVIGRGPATAQTTSYIPALDKFTGTWRWVSGSDTVEIALQKQLIYINAVTPIYVESLIGWHRYVKNGTLIENSMQYYGRNYDSSFNLNNVKSTLIGATQKPTNLYLSFTDLTLNKREELWFTLLPNSLTQATWKLREARGLYMGPSGTAGRITLPKDIVLTKQ